MRYIKYFESSEEIDYINQYGLYPEDIKDIFSDIEDNDYSINVIFKKKLFNLSFNEPFRSDEVKLKLEPFIEVQIRKLNNEYNSPEMSMDILSTDTFKENISTANMRLKDYGWEIKGIKKEYGCIIISICKIFNNLRP